MTYKISVPEMRGFSIGNVRIPNPLVLAPMAGITDPVFRPIIKKMGAGLVYSEMISCQALHHQNRKTLRMLDLSPVELPISIQIFGADPVLMAEAAKKVEDAGASIVDINLGCSILKITKSGAGAVLCRNLPLLSKILESVVQVVSIPVTIKIRIGWNRREISAFEVCRIARECGISAIAVHGRTSSQKFGGKADWDFIRELREKVDVPFIGNGDIGTPRQVDEMLEFSGCDGIMIGREAYPNPWIFRDSLNRLMGLPPANPVSFAEKKELILEHLEGMTTRYGDESGTKKMRKFAAWFTRGLPGSARFRDRIFRVENYGLMAEVVNEYFSRII